MDRTSHRRRDADDTAIRSAIAWSASVALVAAIALPISQLPVIAVVCALAVGGASGPWHLSRLDVAGLAVAAGVLVSAIRSPLDSAVFPSLTCLAVVCGTARARGPAASVLLAGVVAIGALVLALTGVLSLSQIESARTAGYTRLEEWGGYPEVGLLGLLVLPLVGALGLQARRPASILAAVIVGGSVAAGLLLTYSRAAWIVAALTPIVMVASIRPRRTLVFAALALGVAALFVSGGSFHSAWSSAVDSAPAVLARTDAWRLATELWLQRPLTGWGPGTYAAAFAQAFPGSMTDARFHAHNTILHVAAETGLIGVAGFLALAIVVGLSASRGLGSGDSRSRLIRLALLASLIAAGLRMSVDYFDPDAAPARVLVTLAVLAGLAVAFGDEASSTGREAHTHPTVGRARPDATEPRPIAASPS